MNQPIPPKWYKQPWPWVLITIPVISIAISSTFMYFAVTTENTLVVDDYYKEGRAINATLAKKKRAIELGYVADVKFDQDRVVITFGENKPASTETLTLYLYHTTLAERDMEVLLSRDAQGNYRAPIVDDVSGKWRIRIEAIDGDWRLQRQVVLPQPSSFTVNNQ